MINPPITTIILTYRRPHYLKKAIQSVLSQTYPNFQIWVCDNASGDETAQIVAQFTKNDPRIRYFCHDNNVGMLKNYEFGLSLVQTEFFSFLSDDDAVLPNFYEVALQEFQKYPDAGFVAGSTIIMTEKGQTIRIPLAHWTREGKFDPPEGALEMIGKYPVPTSVLFRKKVIEHVAIDFENLDFWDCDYLLQIASIFPIVISKKPCAIFRQHNLSHSNQHNLALYEEGLGKLVKRVQKTKNITDEQSQLAKHLILCDLMQCHKHYFLHFLVQKKFDDAYKIAKSIEKHSFFKKKAIFYIYIVKICRLFPLACQGIHLLRKIKRLIRDWKNRKNKDYASIL